MLAAFVDVTRRGLEGTLVGDLGAVVALKRRPQTVDLLLGMGGCVLGALFRLHREWVNVC